MDELRIHLLGDLRVEGIESSALGSRKGRTLLKVLAQARGRLLSIDVLCEILWGEKPPGTLSTRWRCWLAGFGGSWVPIGSLVRTGYGLRVDWLDIDTLGEFVTEAERRLRAGAVPASSAAATAALALVRGPFLGDEPEAVWAEPDRAVVDRLVGRAQTIAAEAALATGRAMNATLCSSMVGAGSSLLPGTMKTGRRVMASPIRITPSWD